MNKKRIVYLDVIRILACCMIILMHSPHPKAGCSGTLLVPLSFMTEAGTCLFFMVSGALLLPVKVGTSVFLKKRFGKIMGPLIFWTIFYVFIRVIIGEIPIYKLPRIFFSIPFSTQGNGVLWFMYTLAGLYLLAPIVSPFLEKASKGALSFYLLLWMLTLCYPFLAVILDVNRSPIGIQSATGMLYYFSGYAGYFLLGYYMHIYKPRIPVVVVALLFFVPFFILVIWKQCGLEGDFYDLFWYLSILVAMMCITWFSQIRIIVESLAMNGGRIIVELSNACFGIYLISIFIMRYILWKVDFIVYGFGGIGQVILTWLLTLLISFFIIYFISYLPYAEYIIGYKHKK